MIILPGSNNSKLSTVNHESANLVTNVQLLRSSMCTPSS
jgi:hypothetical protein